MAFPEITTCLICEDFREEVGRKMTLLGAFGVSPHVEIHVPHVGIQIPFAFVLYGGRGSGGPYRLEVKIFDPTGEPVMQGGDGEIDLGEDAPTTRFVGKVPELPLPMFGQYRLVLLVDGHEQFRADFQVLQQSNSDLA
jgi:hypothetical protein